MADLENVVWSRERCASSVPDACRDCKYDHFPPRICVAHLAKDALELLKEQGPRVLTLEEVEDALDTVVWVDRPQIENFSDEYALISAYSHKLRYVDLKFIDGDEARWTYEKYGKFWRCWDKRPLDEEREAVKWDVADIGGVVISDQ